MKFAAVPLLVLALCACKSTNPYKGQTGKNGRPGVWEYGPNKKPQTAPLNWRTDP